MVLGNQEKKGCQFEITAVEHCPPKFDIIDQDVPLVAPGGTPAGSRPIGPPNALTTSVTIYLDHGTNKSDITLSWEPPYSPKSG
jgi:hypothetical protein